MHSRIFLNYQPDCQLLQIILLLWKRRPFLIYVINISKYLDSDIKFGFMGNQVYWGNGAATLAVLPNSTTPHIPINRTSVSLANCGRRLWAPRKRAGYQTTNILAEVKIIMYHVKIGQGLCVPTLWQVFPISVTTLLLRIQLYHLSLLQFISQGGLSTNWIYFEWKQSTIIAPRLHLIHPSH